MYSLTNNNNGFDVFDPFGGFFGSMSAGCLSATTCRTDIREDKDKFIMESELPGFEKEDLRTCYPEFREYEPNCRFIGCSHIGEPDCGVKDAIAEGKISKVRYDNYVQLYNEMKGMRKY